MLKLTVEIKEEYGRYDNGHLQWMVLNDADSQTIDDDISDEELGSILTAVARYGNELIRQHNYQLAVKRDE